MIIIFASYRRQIYLSDLPVAGLSSLSAYPPVLLCVCLLLLLVLSDLECVMHLSVCIFIASNKCKLRTISLCLRM